MHESASLARIQPLFLDSKILRSFKMKRSVCPLPPLRSFAQISSVAVLRVIFAPDRLDPRLHRRAESPFAILDRIDLSANSKIFGVPRHVYGQARSNSRFCASVRDDALLKFPLLSTFRPIRLRHE
jgi:hypothetical protein